MNTSIEVKRMIKVGWKLAIVAAIVGFGVYRMKFTPLPVKSHVATVGTIVSEVMGTGTLEARVTATISPRISGLITQVLVDQGERITTGQLLATLYDADLKQQLEIGKAELAISKASVDRAVQDISRAEANTVEATSAYERLRQLSPSKAISTADFDKATQLRAVAEAELRRAQLVKIELERQVVKSEETLRYYQERMTDTQIVSPFDGLVVRRSREEGDIVVPGSEILQIISTEQMWVSAWVDETAIASLAVDQPARVIFRSEPEKNYPGQLTRIAPLADRETREILVDVTVKDLPKTWVVGQRAEVYIETARKDQSLLAPQRAIVWQKGQPGLYVNNRGHAGWRNITLGLSGEESVEITEGLAAGEQIIWLPDIKAGSLSEGRAVAPEIAP